MPDLQFRYIFNKETGRWDVLWKRPNGTEIVVGTCSAPDEARDIVAYGNKQP